MQAANGGQAQVGVEAQRALTEGAEAPGRPAAQAAQQEQRQPGDTQAEQHREGQARQRRVVQRRRGQAAEQQGGKQDEVIQPFGAGPEGFAGEVQAA
ncbi:hypothetical protein D3C71_1879860 [compost metagenome]